MEDTREVRWIRTARRETPLGRLELAGRGDLFDAAREIALEAARVGKTQGRFLEVAGRPAYFKGSPFRGRTRLRHAIRMALLRLDAPRLRELRNLEWLRAHGFGAPEPLAAGLFRTVLGPVYQFLFTARVPAAVTLADFFRDGPRALREPVLRRLANEVARLHVLGFIHHDLYPRNILVDAGVQMTENAGCAACLAWGGPYVAVALETAQHPPGEDLTRAGRERRSGEEQLLELWPREEAMEGDEADRLKVPRRVTDHAFFSIERDEGDSRRNSDRAAARTMRTFWRPAVGRYQGSANSGANALSGADMTGLYRDWTAAPATPATSSV